MDFKKLIKFNPGNVILTIIGFFFIPLSPISAFTINDSSFGWYSFFNFIQKGTGLPFSRKFHLAFGIAGILLWIIELIILYLIFAIIYNSIILKKE